MTLKRFIASIFFLTFLMLPAYANAQVPFFKDVCRHNVRNDNRVNSNVNNSNVCEDAAQGPNANPLYGPRGIITIIVNLLSLVVGIAAVVGIIVAGIKYLTSASNPQEANQARELVIYAIVGLMLAVVAQIIVRVVLYNINV